MQFQRLSEDVEHENRVAVLVFHLLGDLAVDGGGKERGGGNGVDELGEGGLQIVERKLSQNTSEGDGVRDFSFPFFVFKVKKLLELREMNFGPALNFGEGGDVGEQSEQDNGEGGGKGMRCAVFGARIGPFLRQRTKISRELGWDSDIEASIR